MKKTLLAVMSVLLLTGTAVLWGTAAPTTTAAPEGIVASEAKAHVPLGRAQICENGIVKNVTKRVMQSRINAGACRLTACVFNETQGDTLLRQFIFLPGQSCIDIDTNDDGFCDVTGAPRDIPKRLKAINVTPACTDPF